MGRKRLLDTLADKIAKVLWLPDDLVIREVREAENLAEAERRLLSIRNDVRVALRILRAAARR